MAPEASGPPGAPPAEPLLAAALVDEDEIDGLLDRIYRTEGTRERAGLVTRVKSVDGMLEGGLRAGQLVCVSGERSDGGVELCFGFMSTCLLRNPDSTVAVVDSTGNLDIMKLYAQMVAHLQKDSDLLSTLRNALADNHNLTTEDVAAKVLDRVKIMRIFDFVGLLEAVGEIRDEIEGRKIAPSASTHVEDSDREEGNGEEEPLTPPKRTYVADSEEEDDEEMLFNTEMSTAPSVKEPKPDPEPHNHPLHSTVQNDRDSINHKTKLVLIDSLVHVLTPLLKMDYTQGNALASSFLLTLSHLTRTHSLYTILLNPSSTPQAPPLPKRAHLPQHQHRQLPPPPPSIFGSAHVIPALLNILPRYTDVHFLVSKMPRRKEDARIVYSEDDGNEFENIRWKQARMASVVEVVADRWDGRLGGWGAFGLGEHGMNDM